MENVGTATFTVTRSGGTAGAISTTIALAGTATLASDYTTSSLTPNWADGDATNRTVTITVNDDATPESNETVLLSLGAPTGGATLSVPSAPALTIVDNDIGGGPGEARPIPASSPWRPRSAKQSKKDRKPGGGSISSPPPASPQCWRRMAD